MASRTEPVLVQALREPATMARLDVPGWERLLRQARHADLLARVDVLARRAGVQAPPGAAEHLENMRVLAAAQQAEVRREAQFLAEALAPIGVPVTLLKGAAYLMAGRAAAAGRLFSDVDILVPKARIGEVEAALMMHGWATTHHSAYDQRYYRQWMHELPPMQHLHRHTVVDVHHAILPETARLHPDSGLLLAAAQPLPDDPRLQVLAPADMLLHSATHLTHNEELSHGLRDLSDIALLIDEFAADPAFWPQLTQRSRQLGLQRPLYHALRHAAEILGAAVPAAVTRELAHAAPPAPVAALMDALWSRALRPLHASARDAMTPTALFMLYVRAHWLRMPPLLLARHLTVKAFKLHEEWPPRREAANA
jgi:hypothetical protein